jgi:hypothetical protein
LLAAAADNGFNQMDADELRVLLAESGNYFSFQRGVAFTSGMEKRGAADVFQVQVKVLRSSQPKEPNRIF